MVEFAGACLRKTPDVIARLCSILLAGVFLLAPSGCRRGGSNEVSSKEQHAFDKATPELAQSWAAAVGAAKTNDYFGAETLLHQLLRQDLTAQQKQAAEHQLTIVVERLNAALDRGDPAAKAALDQLHSNPPNRMR